MILSGNMYYIFPKLKIEVNRGEPTKERSGKKNGETAPSPFSDEELHSSLSVVYIYIYYEMNEIGKETAKKDGLAVTFFPLNLTYHIDRSLLRLARCLV